MRTQKMHKTHKTYKTYKTHKSCALNKCMRVVFCIVLGIVFSAVFIFNAGFLSAHALPDTKDNEAGIQNRYSLLQDLAGTASTTSSDATPTTAGVLTRVNRSLDGTYVSFNGEAIGDIIQADDEHKWVNILGEDSSMIGVYMTNEQAAKISILGNYHKHGDTLEIVGLYSVACKEHQGELDVHASEVNVLEEGYPRTHTFFWEYVPIEIGVTILAVIIVIAFFVIRHKRSHMRNKKKNRKFS